MSDSQYAVIYYLHSHTTASDGRLNSRRNWSIAPMRLATLAITDHEASAAPGDCLNPSTLSSVSTFDLCNHEVHIVGPNIDIAHPMIAPVEEQKARRQQRGSRPCPSAWRRRGSRVEGAATGGRVAPSPAVILPVFWWRPAMRKNMAEVFKKYLAARMMNHINSLFYCTPLWRNVSGFPARQILFENIRHGRCLARFNEKTGEMTARDCPTVRESLVPLPSAPGICAFSRRSPII